MLGDMQAIDAGLVGGLDEVQALVEQVASGRSPCST